MLDWSWPLSRTSQRTVPAQLLFDVNGVIGIKSLNQWRVQEMLMAHPEAGNLTEGTGGLRVVYYYWTGDPEFWLFTLYDKDDMADLTPKQRASLKDLVKAELQLRRKT